MTCLLIAAVLSGCADHDREIARAAHEHQLEAQVESLKQQLDAMSAGPGQTRDEDAYLSAFASRLVEGDASMSAGPTEASGKVAIAIAQLRATGDLSSSLSTPRETADAAVKVSRLISDSCLVTVTTHPSGASVSARQMERFSTWTHFFEPGPITFTIVLPGYERIDQKLELKPRTGIQLDFVLKKVEDKLPSATTRP